MTTKLFLISSIVLGVTFAHAGKEVTVLTSQSGNKSVVRTSDINDSSKRVLSGWTIAGSVEEINWDKVDSSDASYIENLVLKIGTEVVPAIVLVDKKSGEVLYTNYDKRPCVFTGVEGQNYGCNHFGDSLLIEKSGASLIYTVNAKWDTQLVTILKLHTEGSTLKVDSTMENAVPLMDNQTLANLDSKYSRNGEYLLNRDSLVNVYSPISIENQGSSVKVTMSVESSVPKEYASFSSEISFSLSTPNGKGRMIYKSK